MSRYDTNVAVLVLGYRSRQWLERGAIDSILKATSAIGQGARVIYLDNYSRDGSIQWLQEHTPTVDVLLSPTNSLYCTGVNTLIQYAAHRYRPEYYLLVDADNMTEESCYSNLVSFLDTHPQHGMVQPLVRGATDPSLIYSCGHTFTDTHWCMPRKTLPTDPQDLLDLESCSISSTAVRSSVFEQCGLLHPIYEIYYESADLSARARSAGFRLACATDAVAYNDGTEAEGPDSMHHRYYFNRNRLIYWSLNNPAVFGTVAAEARKQLAQLTAELDKSDLGLDAVSESIRRGLADGLKLATDTRARDARLPTLDGFDKTSAIVLQVGTPATEHSPSQEGLTR